MDGLETAWAFNALGIEFVGVEGREVTLKVPYAEHLVGDPDSGVIHGGVLTTALDSASGWAVRANEHWREGMSMATLDLRIDHVKPPEPHRDIFVSARCSNFTKNIAFITGVAYQDDASDPIATSVSAFMLGTPNTPRQ